MMKKYYVEITNKTTGESFEIGGNTRQELFNTLDEIGWKDFLDINCTLYFYTVEV